jgi:hypothetical protein
MASAGFRRTLPPGGLTSSPGKAERALARQVATSFGPRSVN